MRRVLIRLLFVLVAGMLLVPGATSTLAAPGPRPAIAITASQYAPDSEECAMLKLVNDYRVSKGKAKLRLSLDLGAAAKHHASDMAQHNYFSHTLYDGTSWSQNISNYGYPSGGWRGENIAAGHSLAVDTFTQWKNSPGHNANMLNSNYKEIGIGRAYGSKSTYRWYWTQTFGSQSTSPVTC